MKPFVKWAGGKRQLLDDIKSRLPATYNNYYEPFLGGGAVFLDIAPKTAKLNDVNEQLINTYRTIKNNVDDLLIEIEKLDKVSSDKDYYYKLRDEYNNHIRNNILNVRTAALFIWINKHCFNGLYRVNSKGFFNVPYNGKDVESSIDKDNIKELSNHLLTNDIEMTTLDFEKAVSDAKKGDFVFIDSPYIPESKTSDFVDYSKSGFSEDEHKRVVKVLSDLDKRGVYWMATNNAVPQIEDWYKDFNIEYVDVKRNINSKGNNRKGREVIITNY